MRPVRSKLIACIFFFIFTGVFPVISSWADPIDNWTQRNSGTTSNLNGITYGEGMFVAVGSSGRIVTSPDGTNWTTRPSGTGATLFGVTYGNGTFVAVGWGCRVVTSTDGINWTYMRPFPMVDLSLYEITYGNGLFVAVGYWDLIITSPDGYNWTQRHSGVNYNLHCIAYGNGRFVAGGPGGRGVTSTNGINWSPMSTGFTGWSFADITYAEGIFLATLQAGNAGTIIYSSNGVNWNYQTPPADTYYLTGVAYGNNAFVIVTHSYPNNVLTSPNCCLWRTITAGNGNFLDVAYGDNTFVAVGPIGEIYQSDPLTPGGLFQDVPPGHWAEDSIYRLYYAGITNGCSTNPLLYCPNRDVSKAAMAVFLLRSRHGGNYVPPPATGIFTDVPVNDWFAPWIEQLYREGITKGCSSSPLMYCPDRTVSKASMAVFLLRSRHGANYTPPPATGIFTDVAVNQWYAPWVEQLYREGITQGCSTNPLMYCPNRAVSRAAMAVFLVRAFGL